METENRTDRLGAIKAELGTFIATRLYVGEDRIVWQVGRAMADLDEALSMIRRRDASHLAERN